MLSFFKKRKDDNNLLKNWQIPIESHYRLINNGDSIQFTNADGSHILYFSILVVKNGPLLSGETFAKMQPSVTALENGWQFKGARQGGNEVLVCVFTFTNKSDETWMKDLFANIAYIGR